MKTPFKDIYTVLRINRIVVFSMIIGAVSISIVSLGVVYKIYHQSQENAFAIRTDGEILPLKVINQKENQEVEVLAHLELFHRYFYNIDASNYKKNLDKALWLANSSVDDLYRQKKADGVYNRLLQYSLVQKVISIHSKVDISKEPYTFVTTTLFEINRGMTIDRYELITKGKMIHVNRNFPKNPHGLLITNFYENSLKKINDEE